MQSLLERLSALFVSVNKRKYETHYNPGMVSDREEFEFFRKIFPQLDAVRCIADELDNEKKQKKRIREQWKYVPKEPIDYGAAGLTMFRRGIGRVSSPEIVRAYLALIRLLERWLTDADLYQFWDSYKIKKTDPKNLAAIVSRHPVLRAQLGSLEALVERIPEKFFGLVKITEKKEKNRREMPDGAYAIVLALEQCNRMCGHCGVLSGPKLPSMSFSDFLRWMEIAPPYRNLSITVGEPFFWKDKTAGKNLGDVVESLIRDETLTVGINTSGINFENPDERLAAQKIASLGSEAKERIRFSISVSDYPFFSMRGLSPHEARRKAQTDTIKFALENGLKVICRNFLSFEEIRDEVMAPLFSFFSPGVPLKEIFFWHLISNGSLGAYGRALETHDAETELTDPWAGGSRIGTSCNLRKDSGKKRVSVKIIGSSGNHSFGFGSFGIGITGDGSVIPGCCNFHSPFIKIADMNHIKNNEELTQKTREFVERLVDVEHPGLKIECGSHQPHLTCEECMSLAGSIRHPRRARNVLGAQRFDKIIRLRRQRTA